MNLLIAYWLNEAARAHWLWYHWLDDAVEAFSDSESFSDR